MMYKELLVNLLGYRGSFIVVVGDGGRTAARWTLHEDLKVDEGLRSLAEEVLVLAPLAETIRSFVSDVRDAAAKPVGTVAGCREEVANVADKVYSTALCDGVEDVMQRYERDVESLYGEADHPQFSVAQIRTALGDWFDILPALAQLLRDIERRPTQMLTMLDTAVRFGASREPMLVIMKRCNAVVLHHIASWVVWGCLPEQPGFFIEANGDDEAELVPLFQPGYLPTALAVKILTVGRYAVSKRRGKTHDDSLVPEDAFTLMRCLCSGEVLQQGQVNVTLLEDLMAFTEKILGHELWQRVYNGAGDEKDLGLAVHLKAIGSYLLCLRGDLWRGFAVASLEVLTKFGSRFLERKDIVIDDRQAASVREAVASAFQRTAMVYGVVKDPAFERVSFSCLADDSGIKKLVEPVGITDRAAPSLHFSQYLLNVTRTMRLSYALDPTISELFDATSIELLHNTFSHCMHVTNTEVLLSRVWTTCMTVFKRLNSESRHGTTTRDLNAKNDEKVQFGISTLKPLLCLRRKMAFFIDNLKFYMMTDVLHTKFSALERRLEHETETFEAAKASIRSCLQEISKDAFLVDPDKSNHLVLMSIRQAVQCCLRTWHICYHCLEESGREQDVFRAMGALADYQSVLAELGKSFDRHVIDLYNVLSRNTQVNKYRQLLTRLNFNNYYSRGG
ncbi:Gamma-tubulin complex component 4 [Diplonema papillatum]|nr:Gamma-tubulin complex component 4 [Diplonema papillatum]